MMEGVKVSELGRCSILTLMLKQILDKNLNDPEKLRLIQKRSFKAVFRASRMMTSLTFEKGAVRAQEGRVQSPDLEVSGDIRTLIDLATGHSPFIPWVERKLMFRVRSIRGLMFGMCVLGLMSPGGLPVYLKWLAD